MIGLLRASISEEKRTSLSDDVRSSISDKRGSLAEEKERRASISSVITPDAENLDKTAFERLMRKQKADEHAAISLTYVFITFIIANNFQIRVT
jgi:hypothetical protein